MVLPDGRVSACLFSTELASQLRRASSPEPAHESAPPTETAAVVVAGLRKEFRPLGRTGTTVVAVSDASLIVGRVLSCVALQPTFKMTDRCIARRDSEFLECFDFQCRAQTNERTIPVIDHLRAVAHSFVAHWSTRSPRSA